MHARMSPVAVIAALTLALLPASLSALYLLPDLEQVPVERVIRNLETIAEQEPQNAAVRINLARAHAMAYVLGTDTLPMDRRAGESAAPWVQPPARWVSFAGLRRDSAEERTPAARAHLQAAIDAYEAALRLNPRDPVARLGYGWCLEQSLPGSPALFPPAPHAHRWPPVVARIHSVSVRAPHGGRSDA